MLGQRFLKCHYLQEWMQLVCQCTHLLSHRSPVKKRNLVQNDRALTPKQRMELRKKEKADQEAEHRKKIAARNFSEGQVSYLCVLVLRPHKFNCF